MNTDAMVADHFSYARKLSLGFSRANGLDEGEAESTAIRALQAASRDYDPEYGASFKTYATHKILGYMRHSLDVERRHRGVGEVQPWSITYEPSADSDRQIDAAELLALAEEDPDAHEALSRYIFGETQSEIARDLGVYPSTIKRRIDRAKNIILRRMNQ